MPLVCSLDYIPPHLHTNDKEVIEDFEVGEHLYYRCKGQSCAKPYDNISLYDISHNRNFGDPVTYPSSDVLFNISEDDENERYQNMDTVTLEIKQLQDKNTYIREFIASNNLDIKATLILKHQPVSCMYTHSAMVILLNEIIVTKENYKTTLGRKSPTFKNLRSDIRQELSSILQTKSFDLSEDIEIIEEP